MTDTASPPPAARVTAVQEGLVRFRLTDPEAGSLIKNEVVHVLPARAPGQRLKAEILRIDGDTADAQVY